MAPIHPFGVLALALALITTTHLAWAAPGLVRRADKSNSMLDLYNHMDGQSWQERLQNQPGGSGWHRQVNNGMRTSSQQNGDGSGYSPYSEFAQDSNQPMYPPIVYPFEETQPGNHPLTQVLEAWRPTQALEDQSGSSGSKVIANNEENFGWTREFNEAEFPSNSQGQVSNQVLGLTPPFGDRPPFSDHQDSAPIKTQQLPPVTSSNPFVQNHIKGLMRYDQRMANNDPDVTKTKTDPKLNKKSPKVQKEAIANARVALLGQLISRLYYQKELSNKDRLEVLKTFITDHLLKGEYRADKTVLLPLMAVFYTSGKPQQRIQQLEKLAPEAAAYLKTFPSENAFEIQVAKYAYFELIRPVLDQRAAVKASKSYHAKL
ncbi:hypothetical protein H4R34_000723 [Dimargaris verticillata]|uniref:Uncharacterized protein n=1 Tax=Dimargaris verticillata TaxID=2761393 RepID=A0A9W8BBB3_9FUNG|nr:hypothetical protein H4R34_000723 [Dimargaris verticillata]